MSATNCGLEGSNFVQCRAMDTVGKCASCPPIDFDTIVTTVSNELRSKFMMQMAFSAPNEPEFCPLVETAVCDDFKQNACCCEPELDMLQGCLIEKDFGINVAQVVPCQVSCNSDEKGGGGGGGSPTVIIVVLLVLAILGGLGGYFFIRKRRAAAAESSNGKVVDDDDADTFKDEKEEKDQSSKFGLAFFSMFAKGGNTPPVSDSEEDKRNKKGKQKMRGQYNPDEENGLISDVSRSDAEYDDRRSTRSRSNKSGGISNKRYEEDDSIANDYGVHSKYGGRNDNSPRNSRGGNQAHYDQDSSFDEDSVSEQELRNARKSRPRGNGNLPENVASSRKISSRELKEIMRDREESTREIKFMRKEMRNVEGRLSKKDQEAEDLRRASQEQDRRIRELEAMNARLKQESMHNSSNSSAGSAYGERGYDQGQRRTSQSSEGHTSRSKASMLEANQGQSSRSKASMAEGGNDSNDRERRRNGRSRSASGRNLRREGSNRSLNRQGSNRSIGRERKLDSRSPSSSRGLGKQSSTLRRTASKERLERDPPREYSQDRVQRSNSGRRVQQRDGSRSKIRSKSPRSYLRDED